MAKVPPPALPPPKTNQSENLRVEKGCCDDILLGLIILEMRRMQCLLILHAYPTQHALCCTFHFDVATSRPIIHLSLPRFSLRSEIALRCPRDTNNLVGFKHAFVSCFSHPDDDRKGIPLPPRICVCLLRKLGAIERAAAVANPLQLPACCLPPSLT